MKNIWLSKAEIMALPTSGAAWAKMVSVADGAAGDATLSNQDSQANVQCLAAALVYARTGQQKYLDRVLPALTKVANGLPLIRALALGRELAAYVISADLIDLPAIDGQLDAKFSIEIRRLLTAKTTSGPATLLACQDERPNNWGSHARASITAVGLYLGDTAIVDRSAKVFRGWLGDRASYAGFKYGTLDWQADPSKPVGINPKGATKGGHSIDGGQPEELRRPEKEPFVWPPSNKDQRMYTWEALQGAFLQAELLRRAGYSDVYEWCDQALLRAVKFAYALNWPAGGDDTWQIWLVNAAYGTNYPVIPGAGSPGKNMAFTDWTHATPVIVKPPVDPPPPPPDPTPTPQPDVAAALATLNGMKTDLVNLLAKVQQAITALGG